MKIQIVRSTVLVLIALGSIGCSCPGVWYVGNKAYAKSPKTGKIMSWEHTPSGKDPFEDFDSDPIFSVSRRADGLSPQVYMNLN